MRLQHEYRVPAATCPTCGIRVNGAFGGSEAPEPGDFAVCRCGSINVYTDTLGFRLATDRERADDPRLDKLAAEILEAWCTNGMQQDTRN